jgi:predicted enzyme related to lactoylglutathione lyase
MGNSVVHFEVIGKDAAKLQDYYSQLFGWKIDHNNAMGYGLVDTGAEGAIPGGIGGGHIPDYAGHVTFYVEVEDVGKALDKAEELGGKRVFGPEKVTKGVVLGQLLDPEGHLIGLLQAQK